MPKKHIVPFLPYKVKTSPIYKKISNFSELLFHR